jgi:branched-chain amino acid transport system substrate-binding protein
MWTLGGPYHWSLNASISVMDFALSFLQAWEQVETNKTVGLCAQNDPDGMAWAQGATAVAKPAGYKIVDFGRFPPGTSDYTSQINGWKKENVEILNSNMTPPDFAIMWRQCKQLGFKPKICVAGRAGLFATAMEALGGDLGLGILCEAVWLPSYPFKSSLGGFTAREFANDYEASSGKQWTQLLGGHWQGIVKKAGYDVEFYMPPKAEVDRWIEKGGKPVWDKWVKDNSSKGPAQAIFDDTVRLMKQFTE